MQYSVNNSKKDIFAGVNSFTINENLVQLINSKTIFEKSKNRAISLSLTKYNKEK